MNLKIGDLQQKSSSVFKLLSNIQFDFSRLKKIMDEVNEVSSKNLFLEQKVENFLILEESYERLKVSNEKLSRQLDETLVCSSNEKKL